MRRFLPKELNKISSKLAVDGEPRVVVVTAEKNLNLSPQHIAINNRNELKQWLSENKDKAITINFKNDAGFTDLDGNFLEFSSFKEIVCHGPDKELSISKICRESIKTYCKGAALENVSAVNCKIDLRDCNIEIDNSKLCCLSFINQQKKENSNILVSDSKILVLRLDGSFDARDVRFANVSFSKRAKREDRTSNTNLKHKGCELDRASIAFLHDWATKRGNSEVSHLTRGLELSIEKATAVGIDRILLLLWGVFSKYGLSPLRPLIWLGVFFVLFSALLFYTGASVGTSVDLVGWRAFLGSPLDCYGEMQLAMIGAAEGIVSPLSVFSVRRLVVPDQSWVAVVQVFYNYLCLTMVFLFGFSVRRRFRLS